MSWVAASADGVRPTGADPSRSIPVTYDQFAIRVGLRVFLFRLSLPQLRHFSHAGSTPGGDSVGPPSRSGRAALLPVRQGPKHPVLPPVYPP